GPPRRGAEESGVRRSRPRPRSLGAEHVADRGMTHTTREGITAVVLAAGRASRMGREKLLLMLGGKQVVRHVVDTVRALDPLEIVVVVNPRNRAPIARALDGVAVRLVCNERFEEGMGTSISLGTRSVRDETEALLLVQGDQPLVTIEMLHALVDDWHDGQPDFVAASYAGLTTTPVLFCRRLFPRLAELAGDEGARRVLRRYHGRTVAFPAWRGTDVDTDADYAHVQSMMARDQ